MKIAWDPIYVAPLPPKHRFPMEKYELIPEQLVHHGVVSPSSFFSPKPMERDLILSVHCEDYLNNFESLSVPHKEARKVGLPLTDIMVKREKIITQGTLENAFYAKEQGVSFNVAGGTHHSYRDRGEGFCFLNDLAITAQYLVDQFQDRVLIVDLDVHQGNGTASIFTGRTDVFTFSMHGKNNYPLKKEKSHLDIELEDGTDDNVYLQLLDFHLKKIVDEFQPSFVLYQSGVDALASDKLGRLGMTIEGLKLRDRLVFELCKSHKLPVAVSMGGGYSPSIKDIVNAHCNTYEIAGETFF